ARKHRKPYLGICFGMQLAVLEFARNVAGMKDAVSTEFGSYLSRNGKGPLIGLMTEWMRAGKRERRRKDGDLGGTMRLGAYPCAIAPNTLASKIYGKRKI